MNSLIEVQLRKEILYLKEKIIRLNNMEELLIDYNIMLKKQILVQKSIVSSFK